MATMTRGNALALLADMNQDVSGLNEVDYLVEVQQLGLPVAIEERLIDIWRVTETVAGTVIDIGKIIVTKIIEFCKRNFHAIAAGGIVALITGAVAWLVSIVPWIGPMLSGLVLVLGIPLTVGAAALGARYDNGIIALAKDFFATVVEILNAIFNYKRA